MKKNLVFGIVLVVSTQGAHGGDVGDVVDYAARHGKLSAVRATGRVFAYDVKEGPAAQHQLRIAVEEGERKLEFFRHDDDDV